MTDRFHTLTVVLAQDIREDDAASLMAAIHMLKGVAQVTGNIATPDIWLARERAKMELRIELVKLLQPDTSR